MSRDDEKLLQEKLRLAKLKKEYAQKLHMAFDASQLNSRPTKSQEELLHDINTIPVRWAVSSNRGGKSQCGAREAAWMFERNHPWFDIDNHFGDTPLLMLILGKKSEQMETALWEKKIKPFLTPGTYKEVRTGNSLQKGVGIAGSAKGSIILFQSHNNASEARKNIQGYDAQWAWIDEMPEDARLVSEVIMRITTTGGRFLATFTPLVFNPKVKRMVDQAKLPTGKKYKLLLIDNPSIQDNLEEVLAMIRANCADEADFKARVYGDWVSPGSRVSSFDSELHTTALPATYDRTWRHVAAIDPSASGLTGLTLWAEHPKTGVWYNILAKYMEGKAAFELVDDIEREIAGCNIIERVCDPNPAGYYQELGRRNIKYMAVSEKANNKLRLIEMANVAFLKGQICLTPASGLLEEELVACTWKEDTEGKIVNGSRYHLFDSLQYAVFGFPEHDPTAAREFKSFENELRRASKAEKTKKAKEKQQHVYKIQARQRRQMTSRTRRTRRGFN